MAFFYFGFRARARRFHSGLVIRLNHRKKPPKQDKKTAKAYSRVKALFIMAMTVNIRKARPPKQQVIIVVVLNVIGTWGSGRRKENGHQMKSLSESQL